jgi:hypothetical protein
MANPIERYVIELRTAQGEELLSTVVDWTEDERRIAIEQILRWAGISKEAKARRHASSVKKDKRL